MHRPLQETTRDEVKTGVSHRPLRETMRGGLSSKPDLLSPCPTVKYRLPNLRPGLRIVLLERRCVAGTKGTIRLRSRICFASSCPTGYRTNSVDGKSHRPVKETTRDGVKTRVSHRPLRETMRDGPSSKPDLFCIALSQRGF